jgi:hypothetical protein
MSFIAKDIAIVIIFVITGWMLKTWLNHREKMTGLSMAKHGLASSDQRLERVEQAVEAIAIEIERVSEGQRFVTKLLNERAQSSPEEVLAPAGRLKTP